MFDTSYHFITHWRVESTVEEVSEILGKAEDLVRWWPSVYLEVKTLESGDERGIGSLIGLYTKGWLPYTLRWQFRVTESRSPYGFTLKALGDFVGRGIWTFEQDGSFVNITYDWKITAEKPLLRNLTFLLRPAFSANHKWAMEMGEKSLKLELMRRHARTPQEKATVPAPPPPTTSSPVPMLLGMGGVAVGAFGLSYLLSKAFQKE